MIAHRQRAPEGAQGVARKWRRAASSKSEPARVRCGWALGTGAHPAVEEKLDELARRVRRGAADRDRAEVRAFLLGEADVAAAVGQHLGFAAEKVFSATGMDEAVSVRLRGALGRITVAISPALWTLRVTPGASPFAAPLAELAPSWVGVRLGAVGEIRGRRTQTSPPRWVSTVAHAWRERVARAHED